MTADVRRAAGERLLLPWRGERLSEAETRGRGRLFVFEGPSGVGKTTLTRALARKLRERGRDPRVHASPGNAGGTLGSLVHDVMKRPQQLGLASRIDPLSAQLLHVAAHIDSIPRIITDLDEGADVVLDRCWWSTWVYGLAGGAPRELLEQAIALEAPAWGTVRPSCVFLVTRRQAVGIDVAQAEHFYGLLAASESQYPVARVTNDASVEASEETAMVAIDTLTAPSASPPRQRVGAVRRAPRSVAARGDLRAKPNAHGNGSEALSSVASLEPAPVYETYWHFAAKRQRIYFERLKGSPPPWTDDGILALNRFTNAYRAADRVSQYLIKNVIYSGDFTYEDTIFRVLLFKIFNRIATWDHLRAALGEPRYSSFDIERYTAALDDLAEGAKIYSAAYIMPPPRGFDRPRKYENHLALLGHMMRSGLARDISKASSLREVFYILLAYPGLGPFLAYQYAIDLNYTEFLDFSESEFVVAGPGARNGIRKCFAGAKPSKDTDVIRSVYERQEAEFENRALEFPDLWGRRLQLIDCQNLFCEVDKYSRVAHPEATLPRGQKRIKQKFAPIGPLECPFFPPKWGINASVERWWAANVSV